MCSENLSSVLEMEDEHRYDQSFVPNLRPVLQKDKLFKRSIQPSRIFLGKSELRNDRIRTPGRPMCCGMTQKPHCTDTTQLVYSGSGCSMLAALLTMFILASMVQYGAAQAANHTGICRSVDARNNVTELQRKLRGCRVVEGFVHVVLMDNTNETSFDNISFPELREITNYLLLHRVKGLQSVGALFPNLAVIRGQVQWVDHGYIHYSLMVYQMPDLKELAMTSLTAVLRGAMRVGKAPQLCFANTVDWAAIVRSGEVYLDVSDCPQDNETCSESNCAVGCWGEGRCQLPRQPEWCAGGVCQPCDSQCVGGCDGPGPSHCVACRGVLHDGKCVSACPLTGDLQYEFMGRRCLSEVQCRQEPLPPGLKVPATHWIPFNGRCTLECPAGYQMGVDPGALSPTCLKCLGKCRKVCGDGRESVVRSFYDMEKFKECTIVHGSLTFILSDGEHDLSEELESRFGLVEEIVGQLKVTRSFPLRSLDFLRSLRVVHGDEMEGPAIVVMGNENLHSLWDWSRRETDEFSVRRGGLRFHDNPRLCLSEIEHLRDAAKMDNFTDHDVSPDSNGYKASCGKITFEASASPLNSTAVEVTWDEAGVTTQLPDIIGYIVYYVANDSDHQDECATDVWKMDMVMLPLTARRHVVVGLRPYTRYAYYVGTYLSTSRHSGGQSEVRNFTTMPGWPSAPRRLRASVRGPDTVLLRWDEPLYPRGQLIQYNLEIHPLPDDELQMRDYCTQPLTPSAVTTAVPEITTLPATNVTEPAHHNGRRCCSCEPEGMQQCSSKLFSAFGDMLAGYEEADGDSCMSHLQPGDHAEPSVQSKRSSTLTVGAPNQTAVLSQLKHFSRYAVEVAACGLAAMCGPTAMLTFRTASLPQADVVSEVSVLVISHREVQLQWQAPAQPNAAVLTYTVEYGGALAAKECVPANQSTRWLSHSLTGLAAGSYWVQVSATSLAGHAPPSPRAVFSVPPPAGDSAEGLGAAGGGGGGGGGGEAGVVSADSASRTLVVTLGGVAAAVATVGTAALVIWWRCIVSRREVIFATVNPEYVSLSKYVPDEWEVSRDKVQLVRQVAAGSFGTVFEGVLQPCGERCAVKTVSERASSSERLEFLNEAAVMKRFAGAHHVVRLLGVVSKGQPPLVLMEFMPRGDLKGFLRAARDPLSEEHALIGATELDILPLRRVVRMAAEIADGMAYLEAIKFVHRDLAARNCMVAHDLTVKIGDFGMTRDVYENDYYRKSNKGLLPVRWMAPESLADGVFSSQSDVWSYGVVLWEISTLAEQPYQGLSNEQVLSMVLAGGRLPRPPAAPPAVWAVMGACWHSRPQRRPSFMRLLQALEHMGLDHSFTEVSFYHSEAAQALHHNNNVKRDYANLDPCGDSETLL